MKYDEKCTDLLQQPLSNLHREMQQKILEVVDSENQKRLAVFETAICEKLKAAFVEQQDTAKELEIVRDEAEARFKTDAETIDKLQDEIGSLHKIWKEVEKCVNFV